VTTHELIANTYSQLAEDLLTLPWQWPEPRVARAWEIQRHFSHDVTAVAIGNTGGAFLYCIECNEILTLNGGHQGRLVTRQLRLELQ